MTNILEKAQTERKLSRFSKGVQSVGELVKTLSGPGPFTLFVPSDDAFDRLSAEQQANLFQDPEKLAKVLKYHVAPGYYRADDLFDHIFLKTLEGPRLRVWADIYLTPLGEEEVRMGDAMNFIAKDTVTAAVRESIKINGAHIIQADLPAENGIMHVIEKVLHPPFLSLGKAPREGEKAGQRA